MGFMEKLGALIELIRLHNLLVAALTTLIGYTAVSVYSSTSLFDYPYTLYVVLVVVLVAAGGYVINDYYDIDTDKLAKPWRPIPSGRISRKQALIMAWILFLSGIMLSFVLDLVIFIFTVVNALLVYEYSRWIKRTGFPGNLVVALNSSATILMGVLAKSLLLKIEIPVVTLIPAVISFLLVLGREIVKGIEDYYGDKESCYLTIPVSLGVCKASKIASLILVGVIIVSPIPYLYGGYNILYMVLALFVDAIIINTIVSYARFWHDCSMRQLIKVSSTMRSRLKVAFLIGSLAFIFGVIPI